jgi:hypothetical protein
VSEQTIFIIGAVIFAITIYGSVMAGGLALTRLEASETRELNHDAGAESVPTGLPSSAGDGQQDV